MTLDNLTVVICHLLIDLSAVAGVKRDWSISTSVPDGLGFDDVDYDHLLIKLEETLGIKLDLDGSDYGDTAEEIAIALLPMVDQTTLG